MVKISGKGDFSSAWKSSSINKEWNITSKPVLRVWLIHFSTYFYHLLKVTKSYHFSLSLSLYIYIYAVIHRNTFLLYHNSSVWVDTWDAWCWDRNAADFTLVGYLTAVPWATYICVCNIKMIVNKEASLKISWEEQSVLKRRLYTKNCKARLKSSFEISDLILHSCDSQTDCVVSQLISVARYTRLFKLGLKPS